jgi:hypothetical protein
LHEHICHPFMLPLCNYFLHYLNSFAFGAFVTTVNEKGLVSVFRDQEVIRSNVQLPMRNVNVFAVAATYMDGEPCMAVAGWGIRAGVSLRHAVTLGEVRLSPYKEDVRCVCINATGTKLFFGTETGLIC